MTAQNPPVFLQAESHPAEDVRRWIGASVDNTPGVVTTGGLAASQKGTPNMSVDVAAGQVYISGTEATYQGMYFAENRGVQNVTLAASNPTNPRRDIIVARIQDSAYSGATDSFTLEAITGTPAAVPVDPTIPANCFQIARVAVAALATTITNANITDLRTKTFAQGVANIGKTALLTAGSGQSMANAAYTSILYATEVSDLNAWHSTAVNTDRIIPTVAGLYLVTAHAEMSGIGSAARIAIAVTKNGTQIARQDLAVGALATPDLSLSTVVDLNGSTDYVTSEFFHNHGSAQALSSARFSLSLLYQTA